MSNYGGASLSAGLLIVALATSTSATGVESSYLAEKLHYNAIKLQETPYSTVSTNPTIGPDFEQSRQDEGFYGAVSEFYESLLISQKPMNRAIAENLNESVWDLYLE